MAQLDEFLAVLDGDDEAAERMGIGPAEAERLRLAARVALRARSRRPWWPIPVAFLGVFVVSGAVAQLGVTELYTFSANTPARASEINANFDLVEGWIIEKVGAVNSDDVTITGALTTDGTSSNTLQGGTALNGGTTANGGLGVNGGSTLNGGATVNSGLNVASGDFNVTTGNASVVAGDLTVRDGTFIQGGITANCTGAATDASGCVADSDGTSANYGRANADSFHTNGLGNGQMYIEGYYIDANNTIQIGTGFAGGMDVENVQIGGDLNVSGGLLDDEGETNHHIGGSTNTAFSTRTSLGTSTNRICFLTGAYKEAANERFGCRVTEDSGVWYLEGIRGGSLDMDCWAHCVNWN